MSMDGGGRREPDRFADVAHRRRVAVLGRVLADEVEDLLLALGQIHLCVTPVPVDTATNMCSHCSAAPGRTQAPPALARARARRGLYSRPRALVAELVDAQG